MLNLNQIQIQIQSQNMTLYLNFANFELVKKISSYFADFEQVKNLIVILLTLNKLKKLTIKLPWMPTHLFFGHGLMLPTLHPGFSDL